MQMDLKFDKWVADPVDNFSFSTFVLETRPLSEPNKLCRITSCLLHTCSANGLSLLSPSLVNSLEKETQQNWQALFGFLKQQRHRDDEFYGQVRPYWEMHKFFFFLEGRTHTRNILKWVPELTLVQEFTNRGAGGANPTYLITFEV
jgi:hypothetical protein